MARINPTRTRVESLQETDTNSNTYNSSNINKIITNSWKEEKDDVTKYYWSIKLASFIQEISIIGIKYVNNKTISLLRRLFWLSLILLGFSFMLFQVQDRFNYYKQFDTKTRISITFKEEIRFPTVTICNENRMSKNLSRKYFGNLLDEIGLFWSASSILIGETPKYNWSELYQLITQPKSEAVEEVSLVFL